MTPLEQLFGLEIEFYRRLRCEAPGTPDAAAVHTSYALQSGYERLLTRIGCVAPEEVEHLSRRHGMAGDPRDVVAARDSLTRLVGLGP